MAANRWVCYLQIATIKGARGAAAVEYRPRDTTVIAIAALAAWTTSKVSIELFMKEYIFQTVRKLSSLITSTVIPATLLSRV